ncbi:MAG: DUF4192 domain-containing protein [Tessaracoccus sp.]|uniref:DUF4192 family protein n=1 Tax=Tessaracoccus sp. TaxID=1971211 RepID=UPI001EC7B519|nr:DUF4192 family protein [Tessaracoccus sp.]MBK7820595.1 DUF4192 domain-containing protein [Tessaracoccus sp.]
MKTLSIRGRSREDLLAIPPVVLGYHPEDSVVVLALYDGVLLMSARIRHDWHLEHHEETFAQLSAAIDNIPGCRFALLSYGERERASVSLLELADIIGHHLVLEALVTDGKRSWDLGTGDPPEPYRFEDTAVAAQAVFNGVSIARNREEAIAPVVEHEAPNPTLVAIAEDKVARLSPKRAMARMSRLVEQERALTPATAVELAVFLDDDERMVSVLAALNRENADRVWRNLVSARRLCPPGCEANVLALLTAASWLSGRGAVQTACLEQLAELDPRHVVGRMMADLHRRGAPPSRLSEEEAEE